MSVFQIDKLPVRLTLGDGDVALCRALERGLGLDLTPHITGRVGILLLLERKQALQSCAQSSKDEHDTCRL